MKAWLCGSAWATVEKALMDMASAVRVNTLKVEAPIFLVIAGLVSRVFAAVLPELPGVAGLNRGVVPPVPALSRACPRPQVGRKVRTCGDPVGAGKPAKRPVLANA